MKTAQAVEYLRSFEADGSLKIESVDLGVGVVELSNIGFDHFSILDAYCEAIFDVSLAYVS